MRAIVYIAAYAPAAVEFVGNQHPSRCFVFLRPPCATIRAAVIELANAYGIMPLGARILVAVRIHHFIADPLFGIGVRAWIGGFITANIAAIAFGEIMRLKMVLTWHILIPLLAAVIADMTDFQTGVDQRMAAFALDAHGLLVTGPDGPHIRIFMRTGVFVTTHEANPLLNVAMRFLYARSGQFNAFNINILIAIVAEPFLILYTR